MGGILETAMLICFGCSWPINLVKNYKCRSAEPEADDTAMDLMAASVAEQVQQRSKERTRTLRPKAAGNAAVLDYIQWGKTIEE